MNLEYLHYELRMITRLRNVMYKSGLISNYVCFNLLHEILFSKIELPHIMNDSERNKSFECSNIPLVLVYLHCLYGSVSKFQVTGSE